MEIAKRLKKARQEAGLSLFKLALKTKINPRNIAYYETGKVIPRIDKLCVIARALGKPISFFIPERPKRKKNQKEKEKESER